MSKSIIPVLDEELEKIKDNLNPGSIRKAIEKAFLRVEEAYISLAREGYKLGFGKFGYVGSCALLSVVIDNTLYVANLGDSKGLLFSELNRGE